MHEMICELATYERSEDLVVATPDDLSRALFGAAADHAPEPGVPALDTSREGSPAVFALVAEIRDHGGDLEPGERPGDEQASHSSAGDETSGREASGGEASGGEGAEHLPAPVWRTVGMALWFRTYSTWTGRHGIWLEDLYVRPAARGGGLGRALLAALARECLDAGYRRLEWSVLDWNTDAQAVYAAVGAKDHEGWSTWRLDGDALAELASSG